MFRLRSVRVSSSLRGGDGRRGFGDSPVSEKGSEVVRGEEVTTADDVEFERRLASIRRETPERKRKEIEKDLGPLDYDSPPVKEESSGSNLAVGVGGGIAAFVLLCIFLFSDILPDNGSRVPTVQQNGEIQLSAKEKASLQLQVDRFEAMVKSNPEDRDSLEGLAVSYAELGDFEKAAEKLTSLIDNGAEDVDAIRLLAEVRAAQKKYDLSAVEYRRAIQASPTESGELLQGLAEVLISDNKQDEAVGEILAAKSRITKNKEGNQDLDKIQLNLLLARAYAAGEKLDQASSTYDEIISENPEDFRGYLAKGVLLRSQKGREGEAAQLFSQARFLAPEKAKGVVDNVVGRKR